MFRPTVPLIALLMLACSLVHEASAQSATKKQRAFEFTYAATVQDVPPTDQVRVWVPVATSNAHQVVQIDRFTADAQLEVNQDKRYGNAIGYFEPKPNADHESTFELTYQVTRDEAKADGTAQLTDLQQEQFLAANRLVPVEGRPTELLKAGLPKEPVAAAAKLYELVENHMTYDKSKPGYGNGDSTWACDSKTGNCTDFHSLFISLARSRLLPARFEIGFPLPNDKTEGTIGGYHCWAWFFAEGTGWTPVDISEADKHPELKDYYFGRLTPDRIAFSTGRDIELVPKSVAGPLNYFVYPHVEVDGKVWPKEKIKLAFSFQDASQKSADQAKQQ